MSRLPFLERFSPGRLGSHHTLLPVAAEPFFGQRKISEAHT